MMRRILKKFKIVNDLFVENGVHGFSKVFVFFDLIYCKKILHATYNEYFLYGFQNLKNSIRKNYLLRYHQRARYPLVDNDIERKLGSGKDKQYKVFWDIIGREWIYATPENLTEIKEFIKKHGKVIFKPVFGSQGKGIFSVSANEMDNMLAKIILKITDQKYICEEYLVQHPKMNQMNSYSVNTIRIITLCDGDNVKIISAALRTSVEKKVCDNLSDGGLGAAVDTNTGVIVAAGCDYNNKRYFYHPDSNTELIGFEIPYWSEVTKMVKEAALRVNRNAIVGWDIAISEVGPCLIEANNRPAGKAAQISLQQPCGEEIINYINKNWRKYHKKIPKGIKELNKRFG